MPTLESSHERSLRFNVRNDLVPFIWIRKVLLSEREYRISWRHRRHRRSCHNGISKGIILPANKDAFAQWNEQWFIEECRNIWRLTSSNRGKKCPECSVGYVVRIIGVGQVVSPFCEDDYIGRRDCGHRSRGGTCTCTDKGDILDFKNEFTAGDSGWWPNEEAGAEKARNLPCVVDRGSSWRFVRQWGVNFSL